MQHHYSASTASSIEHHIYAGESRGGGRVSLRYVPDVLTKPWRRFPAACRKVLTHN